MTPKMPQDPPKMARDSPSTAPRRSQDGPQMAPRRAKRPILKGSFPKGKGRRCVAGGVFDKHHVDGVRFLVKIQL